MSDSRDTLRELCILLVEDDTIDQQAIVRAFARERIANKIIVANDGVEAIEHLRGTGGRPRLDRPYIVLLDWNLPRMNGLEFLRELRSDPALRDTIVFVLTTSRSDEDRLAAYGEHVAGYILKEMVGHTFLELVHMLNSYWTVVALP